MTQFFSDPKLFNYCIMVLYACAATRWFAARQWTDAIYWTGALIITLAVTFGYKR